VGGSVPSKVRNCAVPPDNLRSENLVLAHFQHSKFNAIYTYPMALLTLGTLDCLCLHGCAVAQLHALSAQQNKDLRSV